MAANGLQYGAQLEIRMRDGAGPRDGSTPRAPGRGRLTYRRMFGYVATPVLGQIRVGSGQVRASEVMYVGHMMGTIATGLWDGDLPNLVPDGISPSLFWYANSLGNNMTAISYVSPQFFGVDFGISYAPNNGNFGGDETCAVAAWTTTKGGVRCDMLAASNLDAGALKPRNIVDVMLRYRASYGQWGVAVAGGVVTSDAVAATGNAQASERLRVGLVGAQVSRGGWTLGGIVSGGRGNYAATIRENQTLGFADPGNATAEYRTGSPLNLLPRSGNKDSMLTWQIGARYAFDQYALGVAYHQARYEGSIAAPADATDQGVGVGATMFVAPGLSFFAEFLFGRRREGGVDLRTGQLGDINNRGTFSIFGLGVSMNW
jgi:predicted porin